MTLTPHKTIPLLASEVLTGGAERKAMPPGSQKTWGVVSAGCDGKAPQGVGLPGLRAQSCPHHCTDLGPSLNPSRFPESVLVLMSLPQELRDEDTKVKVLPVRWSNTSSSVHIPTFNAQYTLLHDTLYLATVVTTTPILLIKKFSQINRRSVATGSLAS